MRWRLAVVGVLAAVGVVAMGGVGQREAVAQPPAGGRGPAPGGAKKSPEDAKEALAAARWLEKSYNGSRPPEAVRMLAAIASGSQMGPGEGWFGPCQTRYTWEWLARLHEVKKGGISSKQFRGPAALFSRLDRNKDGRITADDLDWSDNNPYLRQAAMVNRLFGRINAKRDGKITQEELLAFFKLAAQGKDHLTPEDLRDALLAGTPTSFAPGDAPSRETLVRGLFAGEIGSLNEGPAVDQPALDFALKLQTGKATVRLSEMIRGRPLVLVFGNFTCGPFRAMYPGVEELHQRYKDRASFLGVYVREAHPTDGWAMSSNTRSGVAVPQPKTFQDRVAVCTEFCQKLKPTIPFLVDEINDPVGHAYSGMPARLYVIDPQGKVAYKSGRGPFGFKVGELEQALVMALLESPPVAKTP